MKKIQTALYLWLGLITAAAQSAPGDSAHNVASPAPPAQAGVPAQAQESDPDKLTFNFRGAPLEMVLNYLSEAAGFIIVQQTQVRGTIDAWSNQPLTRDEAVDLLNTILANNGYAAIRNGRTLTIVNRDSAKTRNVPVYSGANPEEIPISDEIATQVIPVRYINAVQLKTNLEQLLPPEAALTANESGNALIMTDTQANIRRMAEIIRALDTSLSSISTIRVYPLRFADAKEFATIIQQVFQPPAQSGDDLRRQIRNRFGGRFGGGREGENQDEGGNDGRPGASRVVAVADERTNSLVVSCPEEYIPTIDELVASVDTDVQDVTELRVFALQYADPLETATLLTELFADSNRDQNQQGNVRFGGRGRGGRNQNNSQQSERALKQSRVVAVADQRTSSIIVSASHQLMEQIAPMIAQLDSDPARKQKVFVYSLENADVTSVEDVLRGLFESQNTFNNTRFNRNNQNNNALENRNARNQQGGGIGAGFGARTAGQGGTLR